MKRNRTQYDPDKLEALAAQARQYAEHMMRTTGSVPATLIADTEDGYIFCMPSALTDETAKDHFAEVARVFAVAHDARALVMIVEAWARLPDANGHLDTEIPPSQAPDRREVVAVILEDARRCATGFIPILRDSAGAFEDFGEMPALEFGESAGRFSQLMPRTKPSARERLEAAALLEKLGFDVANRGFDPNLN